MTRPRAATPVPPSPPAHSPDRRRRLWGLITALAALLVLMALSLLIGSNAIAPSAVWAALVDPGADPEHFAIRDLRLPRTVVGLVVGAALGASGAVIQALTRNPLADPGTLGVNAGAAFAVAIGIGVFSVGHIQGYLWFAFAGALIVTLMVLVIGSSGFGRSPVLMVLAGVSVGAVLGGATTALTLLDPDAFDQMRSWRAGSIVGRPLEIVWPVLPFLAAGLVLGLFAARALNAMALGDELAAGQGVRLARTRALSVAAITLLAGGAAAVAGPIGFIGLMIPHVARWIVGPDHRWIIGYSLLFGPSLLLASDVLGRIVMTPDEIPVGVITAFIGAPVLIVLVRRRKASAL